MKHFTKTLMAAFGLITAVAMAPTASASGSSLHLNLPGISIGVHDGHGNKKYRNRHRSRHHNSSHYRDDYYRDKRYRHRDDRRSKRYYNQRRNNDYYYSDRKSKRYYNTRRYNDNYYYGGRGNNDRRYYNDSRYVEVCPVEGYSRNYNRNRSCYKHKGHFHCS